MYEREVQSYAGLPVWSGIYNSYNCSYYCCYRISRSFKECMREMYRVTLVYLFGLSSTTLITILTIVVSLSRSLRECMRERYRVTLVCLFGLASTTHITVLTIVVIAQVGA